MCYTLLHQATWAERKNNFGEHRDILISKCNLILIVCLIVCLILIIMSRTRFRVNPHSIVAYMSRNSLLEAGVKSKV